MTSISLLRDCDPLVMAPTSGLVGPSALTPFMHPTYVGQPERVGSKQPTEQPSLQVVAGTGGRQKKLDKDRGHADKQAAADS